MKKLLTLLLAACIAASAWAGRPAEKRKPLKGPLVVLTFDDATQSRRLIVAPLLKKYGFGATFYVCEFPGFENKGTLHVVGTDQRSWTKWDSRSATTAATTVP